MSRIHIYGVMRPIPIVVVLAAVGLAGCAGASVSPAKPPARTGEESVRTRVHPPKLIAPPPAYGNKIVMAKTGEATKTN